MYKSKKTTRLYALPGSPGYAIRRRGVMRFVRRTTGLSSRALQSLTFPTLTMPAPIDDMLRQLFAPIISIE